VTGMWAQRPAETLIHLPVVVQAAEGHSGWSGSAMADAGSEVDIISLKLAQHLGLKISPLPQAVAHYLDGRTTPIYGTTEVTFTPKDSNGATRTDTAQFLVMDSEAAPLILGMPWHEAVEPLLHY